ncbi:MAG: electron transfer flavoprotein subunit beta/FixA family protein [Desulfovermiculus sp.]|nr:electron transfer flavoprotein subunit beta/FixA family protein [Desulfovermiculus sp.]
MNILVCVKRVPDIGAKIDLTPDRRNIVTKNLGFTISPHEECAVEEAIQLIEKFGGSSTVLTLGPGASEEQIRDCMARGVDGSILVETDGDEWDPLQTATAIVQAVKKNGDQPFDLILLGNESADSADFQVGTRVAHGLDLPCLSGMKDLEIQGNTLVAKREVDDGWEVYEAALPVVVTVKEGINLPRYPSLRGTMKAKKKPVQRSTPQRIGPGLEMVTLKHPPDTGKEVEMLGEGPQAAPKVVEILKSLEVI